MLGDEDPSTQAAPGSDEPGFALGGNPLVLLRDALTFLTRLPLPGRAGVPPLARAMPAFPVAGALIGLAGGVVFGIARLALSPLLAAILAQAALCLLTGALHEDGLADTADGLGARGGIEKRLAILRDPRLGTFGALALGFALAIRIGAVAGLGDIRHAAGALIAAHALARAAIPVAMRQLPPARADGLGAGSGLPTPAETGIAVMLAVIVAALALPPGAALAALIGAAFGAGGMGWLARRAFSGFTGDILGAIEQAAETLALLALVAVLK